MTSRTPRNLAIRPMKRADADSAARMLNQLHGMRRITAEFLKTHCFVSEPVAHVVLAFAKSRPVGLALTLDSPNFQYGHRDATLHYLFVMPRHRSRGIGTLLVAYVAHQALSRGCACLCLGTGQDNARAQKLYGSLGFRQNDFRPLLFTIRGRPLNSLAKKQNHEIQITQ